MRISNILTSVVVVLVITSCTSQHNIEEKSLNAKGQEIYQDKPFLQEYSIKYLFPEKTTSGELLKVAADRNKNIHVLTTEDLFVTWNGNKMAPGDLVPEVTYRHMRDKSIQGMLTYQNQFVYADPQYVFSNAWAGTMYVKQPFASPRWIAGGDNFDFLVSDGKAVVYMDKQGKRKWEAEFDRVLGLEANADGSAFLIVQPEVVLELDAGSLQVEPLYAGEEITAAVYNTKKNSVVIGTRKGWLEVTNGNPGELRNRVPWPVITDVEVINDALWFGSDRGAYKLQPDGKYSYYASRRWLPDNKVVDIEAGPEGSVLVLTETGLGQICYESMTLHDKAMELEDISRKHYIRYGFSSRGYGMKNGNLSQLTIADSDNDGLWTGMYLGGQLFRYAVTKDPEAWENCKESLMGFERLYSITGVPGLPARAYEVMGYESSGYTNALNQKNKHLFEGSGYDIASSPWRKGTDGRWVWKSTTSSDEVVGHVFALSLFADLADDPEWKERARKLVVGLIDHIYTNDLYLIDWNGKPTTWGKWNPEYTNSYPPEVGDRKLTSSNIIAFLQAGYHFTGDQKYIARIEELFKEHGYLENLTRPMAEIGSAGNNEDEKIESWAEMLSDAWNHSDDEMYVLGYWSLYPYAFKEELKPVYKEAIRDHWEAERPEKEPIMNLTYAMTGAKEFDLAETVLWLQKHPIEHVDWQIRNAHRKDIELLPPNFREQYTREVLSPAEVRIANHAKNRFVLDYHGNGSGSQTPGDVWLLPYWMGRYLNVISAPVE